MTQDTDFTLLTEILAQRKASLDPSMDDDEFFEFFSAQQVLRDYQLDPHEIKSGVVGQSTLSKLPGSDGGIDAIYLLVNGRLIRDEDQTQDLKALKQNIVFDVIVLQASLETGFTLQRLLRLKDTSENIFRIERSPDKFSETYNEPLLDSIRRFREAHRALLAKYPTINVHFFYVTRGDSGSIAADVGSKANEVEAEIKNILATITTCNFTFVGARDLIGLDRKPPKSTFSLKCTNSIAGNGGYLALVELAEYRKLITSEKGELLEYLFESNVRDYQGDVEVNKQIRETLEKQADNAEFWWLNNGITILAEKVGGHPKEFTLDEPQIVNGLQTSMEVYEHFRAYPNTEAGKRCAVIRLIESPDPKLQDRVIKATNSQTKIPPQYLWATDELQRDIEQVFRASGMHYDRRKNSWRKLAIGIDKVIGMTELAQAVAAAYLQEADHARARPSRYFRKEHYTKVFSSKVPIELYVTCAQVRKMAEKFLQEVEHDRRNRNNLLFYLLMALVPFCLKVPRAGAKAISDLEVSKIEKNTISDAFNLVAEIYQKRGASDNAAKGTEMVADLKDALVARFKKTKNTGTK
ncbi:MAG: AIPR family protein [Terracidiphilus sp.]|jgi:hypothetical protein